MVRKIRGGPERKRKPKKFQTYQEKICHLAENYIYARATRVHAKDSLKAYWQEHPCEMALALSEDGILVGGEFCQTAGNKILWCVNCKGSISYYKICVSASARVGATLRALTRAVTELPF